MIRIPVPEIKAAVKLLKRITPSRASVPVLTHVRVVTRPAVQPGIVIEGTNLDETLQVHIKADTTDNAKDFCIELGELAEIVKGLKVSDTVTFDATTAPDSVLVGFKVGDNPVERRIDIISTDEWPVMDLPDISPATYKVDNCFFEQYRSAATLASKDATRMVLQNVCIDKENIAAGDGRIMVAYSHGLNIESEFLLPISKFLTAKDSITGDVRLSVYGNTRCRIESEGIAYTCKLFDGTYPNYRQVFPGIDNIEDSILSLDNAAATSLVRTIAQFHIGDKHSKPVTLLVTDGGSHLIGEGDTPEVVPFNAGIRNVTKPLAVTVNRTFLSYLLKNGFTEVRMKDAMKPITGSIGDSRIVFMPIRGGRSVEQCLELAGVKGLEPMAEPAAREETETDNPPQLKEPIPMPETTDSSAESSNTKKPDLKVVNNEPVDPFDELLEFANDFAEKVKEVNTMAREMPKKVRGLKSQLKQKDKAFAQAQQAMDQLRKVAGF